MYPLPETGSHKFELLCFLPTVSLILARILQNLLLLSLSLFQTELRDFDLLSVQHFAEAPTFCSRLTNRHVPYYKGKHIDTFDDFLETPILLFRSIQWFRNNSQRLQRPQPLLRSSLLSLIFSPHFWPTNLLLLLLLLLILLIPWEKQRLAHFLHQMKLSSPSFLSLAGFPSPPLLLHLILSTFGKQLSRIWGAQRSQPALLPSWGSWKDSDFELEREAFCFCLLQQRKNGFSSLNCPPSLPINNLS
mmetsp:Transcript_40974/g.56980  ORF Transcript_40974/g.56980 Transcript_40974/m.56980 type:complete len:247 (-) Transcript_40974:49-789(-)